MRGNIIEELYYGNIDPQNRDYCPKSPVKKASDSLNDLEEKLTEQLAGENKELFLRFCNAYAEFMGESELDTFVTGFRLGARLMMDAVLSDDAPLEKNLKSVFLYPAFLLKSVFFESPKPLKCVYSIFCNSICVSKHYKTACSKL